jgi:putative inorganic carbon (HCO3(-)) transporter
LFIPHANELFLQIAAENGVIGLTIFLWLVWSILNLGIQNLKQARNAYDKNLISAILAAVIGFLIYGLFDYTWWYLKVGVLFWFLVGILTSYSSQQNKLEEKRQSG